VLTDIHRWRSLIVLVALLASWWALATSAWSQSPPQTLWLAKPLDVATELKIILRDKTHLSSISRTVIRVVKSSAVVLLIGVPLGLILGYLRALYGSMRWLIDFFRSIPPIVVLPMFFFVWGPEGDAARVALAAFGCVPILVMHMAESVRAIPDELRLYVRQIGGSPFFVVRHVLFYEMLPHLFVGIQTIVSFSVIVIVVSEMVWGGGLGGGIGDQIMFYKNEYNVPGVYAYAILLGALGYTFNVIVDGLRVRVISWRRSQ
jgi:NitT/TauT family transport system permease protein